MNIYSEIESTIATTILYQIHNVIRIDKNILKLEIKHIYYKNKILNYAECLKQADHLNKQLDVIYQTFIDKTKKNITKNKFLRVFLLHFIKVDTLNSMSNSKVLEIIQKILTNTIILYCNELEIMDAYLYVSMDIPNILLDKLYRRFKEILTNEGRKTCYSSLYPNENTISMAQYKDLENKYKQLKSKYKKETDYYKKQLLQLKHRLKNKYDEDIPVGSVSDVSSMIKSSVGSGSFLE